MSSGDDVAAALLARMNAQSHQFVFEVPNSDGLDDVPCPSVPAVWRHQDGAGKVGRMVRAHVSEIDRLYGQVLSGVSMIATNVCRMVERLTAGERYVLEQSSSFGNGNIVDVLKQMDVAQAKAAASMMSLKALASAGVIDDGEPAGPVIPAVDGFVVAVSDGSDGWSGMPAVWRDFDVDGPLGVVVATHVARVDVGYARTLRGLASVAASVSAMAHYCKAGDWSVTSTPAVTAAQMAEFETGRRVMLESMTALETLAIAGLIPPGDHQASLIAASGQAA